MLVIQNLYIFSKLLIYLKKKPPVRLQEKVHAHPMNKAYHKIQAVEIANIPFGGNMYMNPLCSE